MAKTLFSCRMHSCAMVLFLILVCFEAQFLSAHGAGDPLNGGLSAASSNGDLQAAKARIVATQGELTRAESANRLAEQQASAAQDVPINIMKAQNAIVEKAKQANLQATQAVQDWEAAEEGDSTDSQQHSAAINAVQAAEDHLNEVKQIEEGILRMAQQDASRAIEAAQESAVAESSAAHNNRKSLRQGYAEEHVRVVEQSENDILIAAKSKSQAAVQAAQEEVATAMAGSNARKSLDNTGLLRLKDVERGTKQALDQASQDATETIKAAQERASAETAAADKAKQAAVKLIQAAQERLKNAKQAEKDISESSQLREQKAAQGATDRATEETPAVQQAKQAADSFQEQPKSAKQDERKVSLRTKEDEQKAIQAVKEQVATQVAAANKATQVAQEAEQAAKDQTKEMQATLGETQQDKQKAMQDAQERVDEAKQHEQKAVQAAQKQAAMGAAVADRVATEAATKATTEQARVKDAQQTENKILMKSKAGEGQASQEQQRAAAKMAEAESAMQTAAKAVQVAQEREKRDRLAENHILNMAKEEQRARQAMQDHSAMEAAAAVKAREAADKATKVTQERAKNARQAKSEIVEGRQHKAIQPSPEHVVDASTEQWSPQLMVSLAVSLVVAVYVLSVAARMLARCWRFSRVSQALDDSSKNVLVLEEDKKYLRQQIAELRQDFTAQQDMANKHQDMLNTQLASLTMLVQSNSGLLSHQVSERMLRSQSAVGGLTGGLFSRQVSERMMRSQSACGTMEFANCSTAAVSRQNTSSQQWLGLDSPPLSDGEDSPDSDSGLSLPLAVPSLLTTKALETVKNSLSHMLPKLPIGIGFERAISEDTMEQGLLGDGSFKKVGDEAWENTEVVKEGRLEDKEERMSECSHRSSSTSASGKWWGGQAFLLKPTQSPSEVVAESARTPRVLQREGRLAMKKHGRYDTPIKYNIGTPLASARNRQP